VSNVILLLSNVVGVSSKLFCPNTNEIELISAGIVKLVLKSELNVSNVGVFAFGGVIPVPEIVILFKVCRVIPLSFAVVSKAVDPNRLIVEYRGPA